MNDQHDNAITDREILDRIKNRYSGGEFDSFDSWLDKYTDENGAPYAQGNELKDAWKGGWTAAMDYIEDTEGKLCEACGARNPVDQWESAEFGGDGNCPNCGGNG